MPVLAAPIQPALTIPETAAALNVAVITIRRLIASGELRARKVGSTWRIAPQTVTEFLTGGAA